MSSTTSLNHDLGLRVAREAQEGRSTLRRLRALTAALGLRLVLGVFILVLWWAAARGEWVSPLILPPVGDTWHELSEGVFAGAWRGDIVTTLQEAVLGFLIGGAAAMLLGALFAAAPMTKKVAGPYVYMVQTFPKIAIAPLLISYFGFGLAPKVVIAALLAFFPIFTNTYAGLTNVDERLIELYHALRASKVQQMVSLRLPNAVRYIIPSLDVALVLALLGAMAGELAGTKSGVGFIIVQSTYTGNVASIYATLILLAAVGVILQQIVRVAVLPIRRRLAIEEV